MKGTLNGSPFRNWLLPEGDGTHAMPVNKKLMADASVAAGDAVEVEMSVDTQVRQVEVPQDLQDALHATGALAEVFDGLAYSYRKKFVEWITAAKKPETRVKRVEKALDLLRAG